MRSPAADGSIALLPACRQDKGMRPGVKASLTQQYLDTLTASIRASGPEPCAPALRVFASPRLRVTSPPGGIPDRHRSCAPCDHLAWASAHRCCGTPFHPGHVNQPHVFGPASAVAGKVGAETLIVDLGLRAVLQLAVTDATFSCHLFRVERHPVPLYMVGWLLHGRHGQGRRSLALADSHRNRVAYLRLLPNHNARWYNGAGGDYVFQEASAPPPRRSQTQ